MQIVRTPDERFENLVDYPFKPNYLNIDDGQGGELRMHYLDEGQANGKIVLLLHGQPTWSYLYRHMIPLLVKAGYRVLAPDLIGFGKSDKPTKAKDYTYSNHVAWLTDWYNTLGLDDVTVYLQDWGSLIGLRMVAAMPDKFAAVVLANGGLPDGPIPKSMAWKVTLLYWFLPVVKAQELDAKFRKTSGVPGFLYWRKFAAKSKEMRQLGSFMHLIGGARPLSEAEQAGFNAPFPDESYLVGARRFPQLVPVFEGEPEAELNRHAWQSLEKFDKPFLTAFADDDPVTTPFASVFAKRVAGCQGMPHRTITGAGHFLQQDQPEQCVEAIKTVMQLI